MLSRDDFRDPKVAELHNAAVQEQVACLQVPMNQTLHTAPTASVASVRLPFYNKTNHPASMGRLSPQAHLLVYIVDCQANLHKLLHDLVFCEQLPALGFQEAIKIAILKMRSIQVYSVLHFARVC